MPLAIRQAIGASCIRPHANKQQELTRQRNRFLHARRKKVRGGYASARLGHLASDFERLEYKLQRCCEQYEMTRKPASKLMTNDEYGREIYIIHVMWSKSTSE